MQVSVELRHLTSSWKESGEAEVVSVWSVTPADQVVVLHVPVLAEVHGDHLAPEQQALHQHPAEGRHEAEVEQRRHHRARHLVVGGGVTRRDRLADVDRSSFSDQI